MIGQVIRDGRLLATRNHATTPRGALSSEWDARWSWVRTIITGAGDGPSGLTSYVRFTAPSSASTGATGRGFDIYHNVELPTPAAVGPTIAAGQPVTVSCYVRSSTALSIGLRARWHNGTAWLGGASGTSTTPLSAGQWVRLTLATSSPVGGRLAFGVHAAVTSYPALATLDATGLMITESDVALAYGDGDMPGWRWDGAANASPSVGWPRLVT